MTCHSMPGLVIHSGPVCRGSLHASAGYGSLRHGPRGRQTQRVDIQAQRAYCAGLCGCVSWVWCPLRWSLCWGGPVVEMFKADSSIGDIELWVSFAQTTIKAATTRPALARSMACKLCALLLPLWRIQLLGVDASGVSAADFTLNNGRCCWLFPVRSVAMFPQCT